MDGNFPINQYKLVRMEKNLIGFDPTNQVSFVKFIRSRVVQNPVQSKTPLLSEAFVTMFFKLILLLEYCLAIVHLNCTCIHLPVIFFTVS